MIAKQASQQIKFPIVMSVMKATRTEGLRQDGEQLAWSRLPLQLRESREGPWEVAASELSPKQPDRATAHPGAQAVQAEGTAGSQERELLGQE